MTAGALILGAGAATATRPAAAPEAIDIYLLSSDGTLSLRDGRAPVLVKNRVKVSGLNSGDAARGQNLRVVPDTGVLAATDTDLACAPGDPGAGRTPAVSASGYTNSRAGASTTTLHGIDTGRDTLVTQAPPNDGTLNTVGRLGFDAAAGNGFDIAPDGRAVATIRLGGITFLATIDLGSGKARPVAPVGGSVVGLTFAG